eukprot:gnl/Hemi2/28622_TR9494_c0_g2_i1.p1 gnl/Hemi2/28622_TR9494_c0_g2~~gnl/Hemi2/28622_TR9494_c0_g2_i1.p1  ORF type:complete len:364 (-),score=54.89 gnl/Hemi2/28622_TR9494_c0_g2_i1:79-1170(-)
MCQLALDLPVICPDSIPLLRRQTSSSVTLSQRQIGSLLSHAFFSTFPSAFRAEEDFLPSVNFANSFESPSWPSQVAKVKCFLNYFKRVVAQMPDGVVTFIRLVKKPEDCPDWETCYRPLVPLKSFAEGGIEQADSSQVQVDFANKFIGGGVLDLGNVQEEIRLTISPEMIASRFVTEVLDENEALLIKGCAQYSSFTGYGASFQFTGDYCDTRPRDSAGHLLVKVVSIDAHPYRTQRSAEEFSVKWMRRELLKAYTGFDVECSAICTGNWGCGMFFGDVELKTFLQWIAASSLGKPLHYYTFGNAALSASQAAIDSLLRSRAVTIAQLWAFLVSYCSQDMKDKVGLFAFVQDIVGKMPSVHPV